MGEEEEELQYTQLNIVHKENMRKAVGYIRHMIEKVGDPLQALINRKGMGSLANRQHTTY